MRKRIPIAVALAPLRAQLRLAIDGPAKRPPARRAARLAEVALAPLLQAHALPAAPIRAAIEHRHGFVPRFARRCGGFFGRRR